MYIIADELFHTLAIVSASYPQFQLGTESNCNRKQHSFAGSFAV